MYATQTVERTDMTPVVVAGRKWMCRADRTNRFKRIYASLLEVKALPGHIAEIGCWIGLTSYELARFLEDEAPDKRLHCVESFRGLDRVGEHDQERGEWIALPDMERQFQERMRTRRRWKLWKGDVSEFVDKLPPLCWAYVDVDIYGPTLDAIRLLESCMVPGGVAVFDDYGADKWWPGVRKAVEETLGGSDDWKLTRLPEDHMWLCFAKRKS